MDPNNETSPVMGSSCKHSRKESFNKWYVLVMFGLLCCNTNIIWNSLTPIGNTASLVYGWSYSLLILVMFLASIPFFLMAIPAGLLMQRFGIFFYNL